MEKDDLRSAKGDIPSVNGDYTPLANLIVACQPLYDVAVSDLRNQLEDYKIRLFWTKYTNKKLKELIKAHGHTVGCMCTGCLVSHRTHDFVDESDTECEWKPIFEAVAAECGLSVAPGQPMKPPPFMDTLSHVYDAEAHLCSGPDGTWVKGIGVGIKLQTRSWEEIKKYEMFFNKVWKIIRDKWHLSETHYTGQAVDDLSSDTDSEMEYNSDDDIGVDQGIVVFSPAELCMIDLFSKTGKVTMDQMAHMLSLTEYDPQSVMEELADDAAEALGQRVFYMEDDDEENITWNIDFDDLMELKEYVLREREEYTSRTPIWPADAYSLHRSEEDMDDHQFTRCDDKDCDCQKTEDGEECGQTEDDDKAEDEKECGQTEDNGAKVEDEEVVEIEIDVHVSEEKDDTLGKPADTSDTTLINTLLEKWSGDIFIRNVIEYHEGHLHDPVDPQEMVYASRQEDRPDEESPEDRPEPEPGWRRGWQHS